MASSMIFMALIIVLVSGLIAYIGDLVGRKMGRKRLTMFGLRPRHTAIVISVAAGMLIAFLTLLTTFAVSKSVRDAFFTPLGQLKADLVRQRCAVERTNIELTEARRQTAEVKAQLAAQNGQLKTADSLLRSSREQRLHIESQLRQAHDRLSNVQRQLRDNNRQIEVKRLELRHAQAEFARISKDLNSTQDQLKSAQSTMISVNGQIRKLENDKLALEDSVGWWSERVKVLSEFARSSFSPLSLSYGQEILTALLPTTVDDAAQQVAINNLFDAAEGVVRQRSIDLPMDVAALIFIAGDKANLTHITRQEAVSMLTKRIEKISGVDGVIVRLSPINNVPVNGPAFIAVDRIELIPNTAAYTAGSTVAKVSISINSTTTASEILGYYADNLLREQLPAALRAKGMVSITHRYDPMHPNATPDSSIPTVSWADLLAAVEKARALRGNVDLVARAHSTVTTFGPLRIDLDAIPVQ